MSLLEDVIVDAKAYSTHTGYTPWPSAGSPSKLARMKQQLKNCKLVTLTATAALALSFLMVGCDRTISKTESSSTSSDGTVKSKEKTVTQSPDGTVTKTEETKKTAPTKP